MVGTGGTKLSGDTHAVRSKSMNSSAFSCAERSPLRHVSGNILPVAEQLPLVPPPQVVSGPGQSLWTKPPLHEPARNLVLPQQSESFVHVFEQVPAAPPTHVSEGPQSPSE